MELKEAIEQLTGMVREMAEELGSSVNVIKERQDKMEEAMAVYKEAAQKGFTVPGPGPAGALKEDRYFEGYDLAVQGKRLQDKIAHPLINLSEEKRIELAKYFILFLKAGVFQEPAARQKFIETYGTAKASMDVGDPGNVFPLPDPLMIEILAFAREVSVMMKYARIWDMVSEKQSFPIETPGSAAVYWGNQTEEATPIIGEVELEAEELSAYSAVKNTSLADARSDIVSWLAEVMGEAAGLELDNQAFNGDGTITYGILSSECGNTVDMASGETSFADLMYDHMSAMIAKLPGLRKIGARWFMAGEIIHYVRLLKDDNARPIFIDMPGLGVPGTILGYPYDEVIKMPTTDAVSTAFMAFGNLRYYGVGRRLDSSALMVNPYDQWKQNRTLFKIYQRWALKMAMPLGFVRLVTAAS